MWFSWERNETGSLLDNDIHKRLDRSFEFFEQFGKRNESIRKHVELYEFENIEHGIICAIFVNPKEYFELYGILYEVNKNVRELEKELREWILITTLAEFYTMMKLGKVQMGLFRKTNKQTRFRNKKGNMYMVTIEKSGFGQLNDKRYLSCDGISSLPYAH